MELRQHLGAVDAFGGGVLDPLVVDRLGSFLYALDELGRGVLIWMPTRFISSSAAASVASHALPASSASGSPDTDVMASWSCFDSLFHLSSFMKKPNEEP